MNRRTNRIELAAAGCRCPVCKGRADDPEGIHGHRGRVEPNGLQIQPMLPMMCGLLGAVCSAAEFTVQDGKPCVEATVTMGINQQAYTLILSLAQAREADIIEEV